MSRTSTPHITSLPLPTEPFEHPLTAALREHETAPLRAPDVEPILDSYPLLDHRTRRAAVPAGSAPDGQYLAFEDGGEQWLIALGEKLLHIGRGFSADIRIEDPRVSRSHAIVVRYGRHARVLDDRSSNGTFVNGSRIVATTLSEGDVIRVGPVAFCYMAVGLRPYRSEPRGRAPGHAPEPAVA
jgi:hypothetical protein